MEKIVLKVESVAPAMKKDGSLIYGTSQKGVKWQLYKINEKYSYFQHGDKKPDFEIGKEYPFDLEENERGLLLTRPKRESPMKPQKEYDQGEKIIEGLRANWNQLEEIKEILRMMLDNFKK